MELTEVASQRQIKLRFGGKVRGHILFPDKGMLTLKEEKCWFPVPVPQVLRILCSNCFPNKGHTGEFKYSPLQATT